MCRSYLGLGRGQGLAAARSRLSGSRRMRGGARRAIGRAQAGGRGEGAEARGAACGRAAWASETPDRGRFRRPKIFPTSESASETRRKRGPVGTVPIGARQDCAAQTACTSWRQGTPPLQPNLPAAKTPNLLPVLASWTLPDKILGPGRFSWARFSSREDFARPPNLPPAACRRLPRRPCTAKSSRQPSRPPVQPNLAAPVSQA